MWTAILRSCVAEGSFKHGKTEAAADGPVLRGRIEFIEFAGRRPASAPLRIAGRKGLIGRGVNLC